MKYHMDQSEMTRALYEYLCKRTTTPPGPKHRVRVTYHVDDEVSVTMQVDTSVANAPPIIIPPPPRSPWWKLW